MLKKTLLVTCSIASWATFFHVSVRSGLSWSLRKNASRASVPLGLLAKACGSLVVAISHRLRSKYLHFLRHTLPEPVGQLVSRGVVLAQEEIGHAHVVAVVLNRPVDVDVRLLAFEQLFRRAP